MAVEKENIKFVNVLATFWANNNSLILRFRPNAQFIIPYHRNSSGFKHNDQLFMELLFYQTYDNKLECTVNNVRATADISEMTTNSKTTPTNPTQMSFASSDHISSPKSGDKKNYKTFENKNDGSPKEHDYVVPFQNAKYAPPEIPFEYHKKVIITQLVFKLWTTSKQASAKAYYLSRLYRPFKQILNWNQFKEIITKHRRIFLFELGQISLQKTWVWYFLKMGANVRSRKRVSEENKDKIQEIETFDVLVTGKEPKQMLIINVIPARVTAFPDLLQSRQLLIKMGSEILAVFLDSVLSVKNGPFSFSVNLNTVIKQKAIVFELYDGNEDPKISLNNTEFENKELKEEEISYKIPPKSLKTHIGLLTQIVFELVSKESEQIDKNVLQTINPGGDLSSFHQLIELYPRIFHRNCNKLGLKPAWLSAFLELGLNVFVSYDHLVSPPVADGIKVCVSIRSSNLVLRIIGIPVVLKDETTHEKHFRQLLVRFPCSRRVFSVTCPAEVVQTKTNFVSLKVKLNGVIKKNTLFVHVSQGDAILDANIESANQSRTKEATRLSTVQTSKLQKDKIVADVVLTQIVFELLQGANDITELHCEKFSMFSQQTMFCQFICRYPRILEMHGNRISLTTNWISPFLQVATNVVCSDNTPSLSVTENAVVSISGRVCLVMKIDRIACTMNMDKSILVKFADGDVLCISKPKSSKRIKGILSSVCLKIRLRQVIKKKQIHVNIFRGNQEHNVNKKVAKQTASFHNDEQSVTKEDTLEFEPIRSSSSNCTVNIDGEPVDSADYNGPLVDYYIDSSDNIFDEDLELEPMLSSLSNCVVTIDTEETDETIEIPKNTPRILGPTIQYKEENKKRNCVIL